MIQIMLMASQLEIFIFLLIGNFLEKYFLFSEYTDMSMSQVVQRQSVHYSGSMQVLRHLLVQIAGNIDVIDEKKLRIFQCIDLFLENKIIILEVIFYKINDTELFGNSLYSIVQYLFLMMSP